MRPIVMVKADVLLHEPLAMAFIEHNHMIEQITAARAYEAFSRAILPRALDACLLWLNPEAPDSFDNTVTKVSAMVEDQVARRGVIGKRVAQLLRYPPARWMTGYVEMQYPAPIMRNYEEAVQHTECQSWNSEEIHRSDGLTMVRQERHPSLCRLRISGRFPHPVQQGPFRDFEAEHFQFAMNSWRSPRSIFCHHLKDEVSQFPASRFPATTDRLAGNPFPILPKSRAMPTDYRLRLHDKKRMPPAGPKMPQDDPKESVRRRHPWLRTPSVQDLKLLSQRHILQR
jgi:hypothetical protein